MLDDFQPRYSCDANGHEFGCPHKTWSVEQLQVALNQAKQSNAFLLDVLRRHKWPNPELYPEDYDDRGIGFGKLDDAK